VVLYTGAMSPDLAPFLLEMGKLGVYHLLVHPFEDDPATIRSVLASAVLQERRH
jgi:hypothetical protein